MLNVEFRDTRPTESNLSLAIKSDPFMPIDPARDNSYDLVLCALKRAADALLEAVTICGSMQDNILFTIPDEGVSSTQRCIDVMLPILMGVAMSMPSDDGEVGTTARLTSNSSGYRICNDVSELVKTIWDSTFAEAEQITEKAEEDEIWKPVVGYEGLYVVSNFGNVASVPSKRGRRRFRLMKQQETKSRNQVKVTVSLTSSGKSINKRVASLVADAFLPAPPSADGSYVLRHIDGDRRNNSASNLEWVLQGNLTSEIVKAVFTSNASIKETARRYGLSKTTVASIKHGTRYRSVTKGLGNYIESGKRTKPRKLTPEQVRYIRQATQSDAKYAKELGISESHVWRIRHGVSYGDVI